jgi:hypothetical protein
MLKKVYFDNGSYIPPALEDDIEAIHTELASRLKLFRALEGLQISVPNSPLTVGDINGVYGREEDSDDGSDDGERDLYLFISTL